MGYETVYTEVKTLSDILIDMRSASILLEQVDVNRTSKEAELRDAMRGYRKQGVYFDGKPPALAYIFNPIKSLYELFGRTVRKSVVSGKSVSVRVDLGGLRIIKKKKKKKRN